MAKKEKKGAEIAPLFPLAEDPSKQQWQVIESFYDEIQKRVVKIGEIVEHNQRRVDYNLIKQV